MRRGELVPVHRSVEPPRVREGLAYAWGIVEMRGTIVILGVVGTMVWNFPTFTTLLANDTFHGGGGPPRTPLSFAVLLPTIPRLPTAPPPPPPAPPFGAPPCRPRPA